jgi:hypothetical protein
MALVIMLLGPDHGRHGSSGVYDIDAVTAKRMKSLLGPIISVLIYAYYGLFLFLVTMKK